MWPPPLAGRCRISHGLIAPSESASERNEANASQNLAESAPSDAVRRRRNCTAGPAVQVGQFQTGQDTARDSRKPSRPKKAAVTNQAGAYKHTEKAVPRFQMELRVSGKMPKAV
ncbi:hypothetical protein PC116_g5011 [Phytophthora cactorum]|uniref:Uncharacterized protein n=1 Tax=Phytophthora cactorum TaxID=29920 RepID=A0A8T1LCG3_9STRA|nr:hypothetical protein PC112_g3341 [Phytophthora cactorum]KAG2842383.1 hypothetical protein PC111_g2734 [Phytophthora cactorum]KAG2865612.1 hypothetical protein PC113_g3561 [Phytophthora cactorum]KAG2951698.1 hypothetical protein PC117_g3381 [Phytophthora cactorum]KAG2996897.1 hypothetical protein PC118_g2200 [Phytophthora cactorum]